MKLYFSQIACAETRSCGVFDASDHRVCFRRAYEYGAVNLELTLKVPLHS